MWILTFAPLATVHSKAKAASLFACLPAACLLAAWTGCCSPCLPEPQVSKSRDGPAPAIVVPHGGPHSAIAANFYMPFAMLSARGFCIIAVNFRGSLGFGEAGVQSLPGHVGHYDVEDCMAALDAAVAAGACAAMLTHCNCECITWASYGGAQERSIASNVARGPSYWIYWMLQPTGGFHQSHAYSSKCAKPRLAFLLHGGHGGCVSATSLGCQSASQVCVDVCYSVT